MGGVGGEAKRGKGDRAQLPLTGVSPAGLGPAAACKARIWSTGGGRTQACRLDSRSMRCAQAARLFLQIYWHLGDAAATASLALNPVGLCLNSTCHPSRLVGHFLRCVFCSRLQPLQLLETEEGGYRWGKHCSYCRHDRNHKMPMLLLHFRGRRQPVAL